MLLRTKDKDALIQIAKQTLRTPLEIWAYGSRVTGEAHECSDLDLVIKTQTRQPLVVTELADFTETITHSNIPFIVQVFDWYRLSKSFHQNIAQNYEVLFSNPTK